MGVKRIVDTGFWKDEKVLDIFSPEDRYFFLYLLTNPQSRQSGIYKMPRKLMAFELGYSKEAVSVLIERFEKHGVIRYSDETQEIAIMNYLRYSIVKGGKPLEDCIKSDLKSISDKRLIQIVYDHMEKFLDDAGIDKPTYANIKTIFKSFLPNDNGNGRERK